MRINPRNAKTLELLRLSCPWPPNRSTAVGCALVAHQRIRDLRVVSWLSRLCPGDVRRAPKRNYGLTPPMSFISVCLPDLAPQLKSAFIQKFHSVTRRIASKLATYRLNRNR